MIGVGMECGKCSIKSAMDTPNGLGNEAADGRGDIRRGGVVAIITGVLDDDDDDGTDSVDALVSLLACDADADADGELLRR